MINKLIQGTLFVSFIGVLAYAFFSLFNLLYSPLNVEIDPVAQAIGSTDNTSLKISCVKLSKHGVYDMKCRIIPAGVVKF